MKVTLIIWISAIILHEVEPGTIVRIPRDVSNLKSSIHTEYEANYKQKGKHGNDSFSTIKGNQEILHDNCNDTWNEFAEKCAGLVKDLIASLANTISSSPGDATNLQLHIKNNFTHIDKSHQRNCFKRPPTCLSNLNFSSLFNNETGNILNKPNTDAPISVLTTLKKPDSCEEGSPVSVQPNDEDVILDNSPEDPKRSQQGSSLDYVNGAHMNPEETEALTGSQINNNLRQEKYPTSELEELENKAVSSEDSTTDPLIGSGLPVTPFNGEAHVLFDPKDKSLEISAVPSNPPFNIRSTTPEPYFVDSMGNSEKSFLDQSISNENMSSTSPKVPGVSGQSDTFSESSNEFLSNLADRKNSVSPKYTSEQVSSEEEKYHTYLPPQSLVGEPLLGDSQQLHEEFEGEEESNRKVRGHAHHEENDHILENMPHSHTHGHSASPHLNSALPPMMPNEVSQSKEPSTTLLSKDHTPHLSKTNESPHSISHQDSKELKHQSINTDDSTPRTLALVSEPKKTHPEILPIRISESVPSLESRQPHILALPQSSNEPLEASNHLSHHVAKPAVLVGGLAPSKESSNYGSPEKESPDHKSLHPSLLLIPAQSVSHYDKPSSEEQEEILPSHDPHHHHQHQHQHQHHRHHHSDEDDEDDDKMSLLAIKHIPVVQLEEKSSSPKRELAHPHTSRLVSPPEKELSPSPPPKVELVPAALVPVPPPEDEPSHAKIKLVPVPPPEDEPSHPKIKLVPVPPPEDEPSHSKIKLVPVSPPEDEPSSPPKIKLVSVPPPEDEPSHPKIKLVPVPPPEDEPSHSKIKLVPVPPPEDEPSHPKIKLVPVPPPEDEPSHPKIKLVPVPPPEDEPSHPKITLVPVPPPEDEPSHPKIKLVPVPPPEDEPSPPPKIKLVSVPPPEDEPSPPPKIKLVPVPPPEDEPSPPPKIKLVPAALVPVQPPDDKLSPPPKVELVPAPLVPAPPPEDKLSPLPSPPPAKVELVPATLVPVPPPEEKLPPPPPPPVSKVELVPVPLVPVPPPEHEPSHPKIKLVPVPPPEDEPSPPPKIKLVPVPPPEDEPSPPPKIKLVPAPLVPAPPPEDKLSPPPSPPPAKVELVPATLVPVPPPEDKLPLPPSPPPAKVELVPATLVPVPPPEEKLPPPPPPPVSKVELVPVPLVPVPPPEDEPSHPKKKLVPVPPPEDEPSPPPKIKLVPAALVPVQPPEDKLSPPPKVELVPAPLVPAPPPEDKLSPPPSPPPAKVELVPATLVPVPPPEEKPCPPNPELDPVPSPENKIPPPPPPPVAKVELDPAPPPEEKPCPPKVELDPVPSQENKLPPPPPTGEIAPVPSPERKLPPLPLKIKLVPISSSEQNEMPSRELNDDKAFADMPLSPYAQRPLHYLPDHPHNKEEDDDDSSLSSTELRTLEGKLLEGEKATTFQTTSADPTPPENSLSYPPFFMPNPTSQAPPPLTIPNSEPYPMIPSTTTFKTIPVGKEEDNEEKNEDDDEEGCCSCESCTENDGTGGKIHQTSACQDLEQARRELKVIFDKIKKKLKCGQKTQRPTITT